MGFFGTLSLLVAGTASVSADVLMVLTSHDKLGDTDQQTGWYLPEAAHPYNVFKDAGVKMTWASPKGGEAPVDAGSVAAYKKDPSCVSFLKDEDEAKVWKETTPLSEINGKDFDAVFVVGGYGVMWDLVGNEDLQKIAADVWESGGIVSGVCHGPAALVGVALSDGSSLVEGKEVACFTNAEEDVLKRHEIVPKTCEDAFEKVGAKFTKTKPWGDHVATSGRLITGQNPASSKSTAEAVVKALGSEVEEKVEMSGVVRMDRIPSMAATFGLCGCGVVLLLAAVRVVRSRTQTRALQSDDLEEVLERQDDDGLE